MKETETYTKLYDFLFEELDLPDVTIRVLAVIIGATISGQQEGIWGATFIAKKAHTSIRSVKQAIKCLKGIGAIIATDQTPGGAIKYRPNFSNVQSTTEARNQLVQNLHRCKNFTGATNALNRCKSCTHGGAKVAPQIKYIRLNNNRDREKSEFKFYGFRKSACEPPINFKGSDTI